MLLLCDFESQFFLRQLGDQPVERRPPAQAGDAQFEATLARALDVLPEKTLSMGYQAWLGFYNSHLRKLRWSQRDLVDRANDWVLRCCRALLSRPDLAPAAAPRLFAASVLLSPSSMQSALHAFWNCHRKTFPVSLPLNFSNR